MMSYVRFLGKPADKIVSRLAVGKNFKLFRNFTPKKPNWMVIKKSAGPFG